MPPVKEFHFFDRPFPHRQTVERVSAKAGSEQERLFIERLHDLPRKGNTGPRPDCSKGGCSPTYRTHERRPELQAACGLRRVRSPARHAAERRPDERLQKRRADAPRLAENLGAARRSGVRCRLVPPGPCGPGHHRPHPVKGPPQGTDPARQNAVPPASPDREYVRPFQRLPTDTYPIHRCAHTFMSAIALAASVIFWL